MDNPLTGNIEKSAATNLGKAAGFVAIGVTLAVAGIYVGETDDAPGAAIVGFLLMISLVILAVRAARHKR